MPACAGSHDGSTPNIRLALRSTEAGSYVHQSPDGATGGCPATMTTRSQVMPTSSRRAGQGEELRVADEEQA